jgi:hypothetical protein
MRRHPGQRDSLQRTSWLNIAYAGSLGVTMSSITISPWPGPMIALHYMHYNFGRIHKTLRVTPAMEAGVSNHVWSLEEIAGLA